MTNKAKEKIVILGHSGFVGKYLYQKMQKEPIFEVYGFSSREVNLLNLGTYQKLADICDEKTVIVMAAAVLRSKKDGLLALADNVKMAINLADFLSSTKIKHLIYLSTIAIYGSKNEAPITEVGPINPNSFYSSAKACSELILKRICEKLGIALTTLRMGKIYGEGDTTSPIFIFSHNIFLNRLIEIYGDGSHRLYPVHQNDFFGVIKRTILEEIRGDYNVTPSFGITLLELIGLLFELSGKKVEIKFKPAVNSPVSLIFNTSKFKETFGNFPLISLEEGLKEYFTPITP